MGKTFRSYDMNQQLLLPPDLRQWLRPEHLALYVSDVVESLDLSGILNVYEEGDGRGRPPYHPALMVKLLVYGYCTGKMSSRKLEQATYDDVAFRVLSCNQQPDHDSIAYARMQDAEQELAAEVARLLGEAQHIDEEEDKLYGKGKRGDELPEELRDRETRLAKIRALKAELEEEAKATAAQQRTEQEKAEAGAKRYRRPKWEVSAQGEILPLPKSKRNLTDPDSRMMKDLVTQSFQQGYNVQIGVDAQAQIIVGAKVEQAGNDQQQLVPVLQEVAQNLGRMPEAASADGGYFSVAALTHEAVRGVNLHVPPNQREPDLGALTEPLPASASVQQQMWHKLKSAEGRALYHLRQAIVEPVFAQIKHIRG